MADNNDLRVVVGLNIPDSVVEIKKDLRKIENILANNEKDGKLKIVGRLDTDKTKSLIEQQLKKLKIDGSALKITPQLDVSGVNGVNNSLQQITNTAKQAGQAIDGMIKSEKNIWGKDSNWGDVKDLTQLEKALRGIGASDSQIDGIIKRIQNLNITVEKLTYGFKKVGDEIKLTALQATGFNDVGDKLSYNALFEGKSKTFNGNWDIKLIQSYEEIRKAQERLAKQTETTDKALEKFAKLKGNVDVISKKYSGISDEGLGSSIKTQIADIEKLVNTANISTFAEKSNASLHEMRQKVIEIDNAIRSLTVDINNYEGTVDKSSQQTINGLRKQQEQAASFQRQINTLKAKATDVNGSKPIEWNNDLIAKYDEAKNAIEKFGIASNQTYTDTKIKAQDAIEELKRLVTQTKNAEYAASSLRAKNFETVKKDTGADIDKFVQKVQNALGSTKPLENEIKNIKKAFTELESASPNDRIAKLTEVLNQLSNAGSRLEVLKEVNKTFDGIERSISRLDTVSGTSIFTKFSSNSEVVELQKRIAQLRENYQKTLDVMRNSDVESEQFKTALVVLDDLDAKFKVLITDTKAARNALNAENNSTSFTKQVNSLTASIKELQNTATLSSSQKDALAGLLNRAELAQDKATLEQISAELIKLRGEIRQTGTESKNFDQVSNSVEKVIADLDAMSRTQIFRTHSNNSGVIEFQDKIKGLSSTAKQVKIDLEALGNSKVIPPELKTRVDDLKKKFDELGSSNKTLQAYLRDTDAWTRTSTQVQKLTVQIKEYMAVNTRASKKYSGQFEGLLSGLSTAEMNKDAEAVKRLTSDFQILKSQIKAAGDQGKTFGQTIVDNIKKFSSWMSLTSVVMRAWRSLKQMVTTVKELDQAMTSLKKVTNETASSYERFLDNARIQAQKLHSSIVDIVKQTEIWVKLGNDLSTASKLAEVSMIYAKVGDVDNESAVKDLVATMKAFNVESENAINIVSMLDKLNNEFAVSAKDLGEGLTVTASAMAAGGNSLEKTLSLMTGAGEITQDMQGVANSLRTISMRIRGKFMPPYRETYMLCA